jgi:hypothetical protein
MEHRNRQGIKVTGGGKVIGWDHSNREGSKVKGRVEQQLAGEHNKRYGSTLTGTGA